jgi:RNA polymerase sigma-70 factor, ECF subfamily
VVAEIESLIPALRSRARRIIWKDDVEDLVQDTIERAVRGLDRYTPGTNLRGWLFVILLHRGQDLIAHEQRRRSRAAKVDVETVAGPPPEPAARPGFTRAEILRALDEVKEPFREALVMRVLENKSYAEIAEKQQVPRATAGTRIRRARETVQAMLDRWRVERGEDVG